MEGGQREGGRGRNKGGKETWGWGEEGKKGREEVKMEGKTGRREG